MRASRHSTDQGGMSNNNPHLKLRVPLRAHHRAHRWEAPGLCVRERVSQLTSDTKKDYGLLCHLFGTHNINKHSILRLHLAPILAPRSQSVPDWHIPTPMWWMTHRVCIVMERPLKELVYNNTRYHPRHVAYPVQFFEGTVSPDPLHIVVTGVSPILRPVGLVRLDLPWWTLLSLGISPLSATIGRSISLRVLISSTSLMYI